MNPRVPPVVFFSYLWISGRGPRFPFLSSGCYLGPRPLIPKDKKKTTNREGLSGFMGSVRVHEFSPCQSYGWAQLSFLYIVGPSLWLTWRTRDHTDASRTYRLHPRFLYYLSCHRWWGSGLELGFHLYLLYLLSPTNPSSSRSLATPLMIDWLAGHKDKVNVVIRQPANHLGVAQRVEDN